MNKGIFKGSARGGFTLIEVLTVVIIIGILTSIAMPQYRRAVQRSKVTQAVAMLRTIRDSAERLANEYGYKSFKSFSSGEDSAKARFTSLDMFNTDTIPCQVQSTMMRCDDFAYYLNKGGDYIYAVKRTTPYKDVQIRLSWDDIPKLTCSGNDTACEVYNLDSVYS